MDPHDELVELLVDGARYGDLEDVDAALAQHVSVDSKDGTGRTALHMACANGHTEVVRRLLEAGADVDMKNAEENTPLHWACLNGHTDVVRALLEKKASPCALNIAGRTPVDEALTKNYQEILDLIRAATDGSADDEDDIIEEEGEEELDEGVNGAEADDADANGPAAGPAGNS